MVFQNEDRTAEIDKGSEKFAVCPNDYCSYYEKHPYTMLWKKECWTCAHGDFGIDTGIPTDKGVCKYKKER